MHFVDWKIVKQIAGKAFDGAHKVFLPHDHLKINLAKREPQIFKGYASNSLVKMTTSWILAKPHGYYIYKSKIIAAHHKFYLYLLSILLLLYLAMKTQESTHHP